jgi:hypothetical protein
MLYIDTFLLESVFGILLKLSESAMYKYTQIMYIYT